MSTNVALNKDRDLFVWSSSSSQCTSESHECWTFKPWSLYRIAQNFRWIKISFNAHALYWHKNFAEFNFAHSASCSPGSSGWSSRMNTPCPNIWYRIRTHAILSTLSISLYVPRSPFTAALASAMAEGDSSADRGPEGLGKTRGATWRHRYMVEVG